MTEVHQFSGGVKAFKEDLHKLSVRPDDNYEKSVESMLGDLVTRLPDEPLIINLGACFGFYVVFLGNLLPRARFQAYEPDDVNRQILHRTLELNGQQERTVVFPEALNDREEVVRYFSAGSGSKINPTVHLPQLLKESVKHLFCFIGVGNHKPARFIDVETVPFDEVVSRANGGIDLLFSDIQGAEFNLLGHSRELWTSIRYICIATHSEVLHSGLKAEFVAQQRELLF